MFTLIEGFMKINTYRLVMFLVKAKRTTKRLETRHITMISIGGVIGGGLFVGSGTIIQSTGPAAILSYIIGALMVVLVMRMLGRWLR